MRIGTEPPVLTITYPSAASVLGRSTTSLRTVCFRMNFLFAERIQRWEET